ncbi:hypothetical protein Tco_1006851 [Tanacetum coccineum]|uniref:Reverse transcriptase domain-containing protein n=1 Tax=Tanacetum coccineum TaxID=301880 RepID=A0ABQ5FK90_9ASTR
MTSTRTTMSQEALEELINQCVADALTTLMQAKGTKGVVGLDQWFEKMESIFHISKCTMECQVKFATCTLLGGALTWKNSHVRTIRHDAAYAMVPDELDKVEKYTGGLPDSIQWSMMASKSKTLQEAIKLTRSLMDQKLLTYAARQAENKRKIDNNSRNNNAQQQPYKMQNVVHAYAVGPGEKKVYAGTLPLCNK